MGKVNITRVPKKDWTWKHTQYGHEGVHTYERKLLWYDHRNNPHAGGGACSQTFDNFLKNGSNAGNPPEEVLKEIRELLLSCCDWEPNSPDQ